ncbi:MAG: NRDE family protein [Polaromonas sp.]|jgi:uncharacterized protein with NRDE domain
MCLITLSWQPAHKTPLIIAANRDEFYARPARPLQHWPGERILAGKDMLAGGTWLGVAKAGSTSPVTGAGCVRLAALTNYRDRSRHNADAPSRGHITTTFLRGAMSAAAYLQKLSSTADVYNPFNLILFDGQQLMGFESRHSRAFELPSGISSVSNADFNTPWPKLVRLQQDFEKALATQHCTNAPHFHNELFRMLSSDIIAPDCELPHTGLPSDTERALSAVFVRMPEYGTRACSVVTIGPHGADVTERSFDALGFAAEVKEHLSC